MTTCSNNTCGTGFGTVVLPSDPSNNSILSAEPAFGGVDVSWTLPATNPYAVAYFKVFRANNDNFNSAILVATAGGDRYFDRAIWTTQIEYFYWIQSVSVNGTLGTVIGPASAHARPTIEDVIEQLSGQIEYGALNTALKANIDKIELNRIAQEGSITSVTNEQILIRDALSLIQADVENNFVLITEEVEARQNAEQAYASQINTLVSSLEGDIATAQTTLQTNINNLDGKIGALYTAQVTVNGLVGGFGIYNDGTEVEAGFDVDTFWVGRTSADKVKPFIIQDNEVFIDTAVIKDASISAAKIGSIDLVGSNNFNVKTGSTGARMEINNRAIKIYDASGVLRVKIGDLAA